VFGNWPDFWLNVQRRSVCGSDEQSSARIGRAKPLALPRDLEDSWHR
jgi:plasmid maintenance system antidote protein VapI